MKHLKKRIWFVGLGLVLLFLAVLTADRYQGKYLLHAYTKAAAARGVVVDANQIWPIPIKPSLAWNNSVENLSQGVNQSELQHPGSPNGGPNGSDSNKVAEAWARSRNQLKKIEPLLQALRVAVQDPPKNSGKPLASILRYNGRLPNFVSYRKAAQTLGAAVQVEIHEGNREAALQNLLALAQLIQANREEPLFLSQMMRVAIAGLSIPCGWGLLKEPDWTDSQLAGLQAAFQAIDILPMLEKSMLMERFSRLAMYQQLQNQSYQELVRHCSEIYAGFGAKMPADVSNPVIIEWRTYLFHPLWSYAWADLEMYSYLKETEPQIAQMHQLVTNPGVAQLDLLPNTPDVPRFSRFYYRISAIDQLSDIINSPSLRTLPAQKQKALTYFPGLNKYGKAWRVAFRNLTLKEMLVTATALKRYRLRHAQWPANLQALVPDYLPQLPLDLMDGRPLRYHLNADGSFTLYSVGDDGIDNSGDASLTSPSPWPQPFDSMIRGRDLVWPQ